MVDKCTHDDKMQISVLIQDFEIKYLFHVQILHTLLIKSRLELEKSVLFYTNHFSSTRQSLHRNIEKQTAEH